MPPVFQGFHAPLRFLALGAVSFPLLTGCHEKIDIPEGPDLEALGELYDSPQGTFGPDNMAEIVDQALKELATWEELGRLGFVIETVEGVGEAVREAAGNSEGISLSGVTYVDSVCPGFPGDEEGDPDNGILKMTVTLKDSFVEEVIWGDFTACKMNFGGRNVTLTSSMDLYLGGPVPLSNLRFDAVVIRVEGEVKLEDETTDFSSDARISGGDFFELRVPADGGDVILGFEDDLTSVAVRSLDGAYCCDFDNRSCSQVDGQDCKAPVVEGTRFTW